MSEIQKSASILAKTLEGKNKDYAPEDEFSNFTRAAAFVGGGMDNLAVMLTQIAIKFTRLETLIRYDGMTEPNYESIADTLLDLAGYSVIAHAYLNRSVVSAPYVSAEELFRKPGPAVRPRGRYA